MYEFIAKQISLFLLICGLMFSQVIYADEQNPILNLLSVNSNAKNMVLGNPNGNITVVEFTDFNCPYCKAMTPVIRKLLDNDKQVRLIVIEYPVLGSSSMLAAKAALAAQQQNKFVVMHDALMSSKKSLNQKQIIKIATQNGLDTKKLILDMNQASIKQQAQQNVDLGESLGISGTPTFIFGKTLFAAVAKGSKPVSPAAQFGYVSYPQMKKIIDDLRSAQ